MRALYIFSLSGFNAADIAALNGYLSWEERGQPPEGRADGLESLRGKSLERAVVPKQNRTLRRQD